MSDNKNVFFRSSIKGYNKSDVNEYLIRMSNEFSVKEESIRERAEMAEKEALDYQEKIASLESSLDDIKKRFDDTLRDFENIKSENEALKNASFDIEKSEESTEKDRKIAEQDAVIAKQFEEIDTLRDKLQKASERINEAEAELEKNDELVRKAKLYDKTSANIGDAIIAAKKTAEEIVSSAKEEARQLTVKAEKELLEKRRAIEESSARAFEGIFSKLNSAAIENRKEVAGASAYAAQIFEKAVSDIQARNETVNSRLKNYEENLWKSIRGDLESVNMEKKDAQRSSIKKSGTEQIKKIKK